MNIALAIMHLFPQANPMTDFIVQDDSDGNGAYIAHWELDQEQPTEDQLLEAWEEFISIPEPEPSPREIDIIGMQLVEKDLQILDIQATNEMLGQSLVQLDLRLMGLELGGI